MHGFIRASVFLLGCAGGESPSGTVEGSVSISGEPDAAVSVKQCDARAIQEQATALVQQAAGCQEDSDCMLTEIEGRCLTAFLCWSSVNKNTDLVQLRAEAARLSAKYTQCPSFSCVQASCAGPFRPKCNQSTQLCTFAEL